MGIKKEMDFRFDAGPWTADGLQYIESLAPGLESLTSEALEMASEIDLDGLIEGLGEPFDPDKYHEEFEELLYDQALFEQAGIDPCSDPDWVERSERVELMRTIEVVIDFQEAIKALRSGNN